MKGGEEKGAGGEKKLRRPVDPRRHQPLGLQRRSDTGIVTKPEEGQYAVVHGAGVSAEQMSERIIAAASEMNVSAEELGLSRTTQALEENIEAEEITRMIRGMRQKLAERTDDPVIGTVSFAANEDAEKKGLLKTLLSKIQK